VEDIIDSGLTIKFIKDRMLEAGPKSVAIVTLLMKPDIAKLDFDIDWVGFEIPPEFVVGYGLDYDQLFRNLKGVYRLEGFESE
jgi:hypoxanthine phosphoribosyltransferase